MLQHHYDPTLPLTPPTTSHHRRGRQGPLHTNWRSHHRRRCPPTPSSSSTAAIVTITGLVVAWCHLPPPSSSPLCPLPTQPHQQQNHRHLALSSSPPFDPPPPHCRRALSALSIAHGAVSVNALPPGPTRQVPLPNVPPSLGYGPTAPAPPSLSGGRRYTLLRFSGRRRRSGDGNGSTATLMVVPGNPAPRRRRRDADDRPSWSSL